MILCAKDFQMFVSRHIFDHRNCSNSAVSSAIVSLSHFFLINITTILTQSCLFQRVFFIKQISTKNKKKCTLRNKGRKSGLRRPCHSNTKSSRIVIPTIYFHVSDFETCDETLFKKIIHIRFRITIRFRIFIID